MLWILISVIALAIGGFLLAATFNGYIRSRYLGIVLDFERARASSSVRYFGLLAGGVFFLLFGFGMAVYAIDSGSLDIYFGNHGGTRIVDEGY